MSNAEIVATTAAVIGLVIAALSALAAFRSAGSARSAQRWAEESAHIAATLTACRTAAEVVVELQRVKSVVDQANLAYQTLAAFSGSYQNAGIEEAKAHVGRLAKQAKELAEYATPFASDSSRLAQAPLAELARVQLALSSRLAQMVAFRIEVEHVVASVETQNSQYRERAMSR
jgi:hypothetical protein